jgi:oligopeptide/dipeptide ABC transporter ATP-binding protein
MREMSEDLLQVKSLKKYFPIKSGLLRRTVAQIHAVDDVSFQIKNGETVGLVGESGCGKSTLSRCLIRLLEPTGGEIHFKNQDVLKIDRKDLWRDIQMVFQDPRSSLNPRLTIGYSVGEPLIVRGFPRDEIKERVTDLLSLVGLNPEHYDRYPHEFSGGQRQRLLIAKALITDPEFIILDEPTSSLDVSVQAKILNLLNRLKEELGLTYLFVSHDLSVINHMCDRVVVMYLGRIVEIASKENIFGGRGHPYTRLLMESIPLPWRERQKDEIGVETIELPSNINLPLGCRFSDRCPEATDECRGSQPQLQEVEPGHYIACHNYKRIKG